MKTHAVALFQAVGIMMMLGFFAMPAMAVAITPEQVKSIIDGNAMVILFVVGVCYTRFPFLKNWTNHAVPWLNLVVYVAMQYLVPKAQAGVVSDAVGFGGLLWNVARGAATSAVTSVLYDKFVKEILDRFLPKPVPTIAAARR